MLLYIYCSTVDYYFAVDTCKEVTDPSLLYISAIKKLNINVC